MSRLHYIYQVMWQEKIGTSNYDNFLQPGYKKEVSVVFSDFTGAELGGLRPPALSGSLRSRCATTSLRFT